MTGTRAKVRTKAEAETFVSNEMMSGIMAIGMSAGADVEKVIANRERFTEALSTWLDEQSLSKIKLEIRAPYGEVLDTYVFDVSYDGDMGFVEFPDRRIKREVDEYDREVYVDINPVTYGDKRSADFGFSFSEARSKETKHIDKFGAGHIEVDIERSL